MADQNNHVYSYLIFKKHKVELVKEGVWIHTENPDTGEKIRIYVGGMGSPDGVIVDFWRGDESDADLVQSYGLEWIEDSLRNKGGE